MWQQVKRQVFDLNAVLHASNNLDLWDQVSRFVSTSPDNNYWTFSLPTFPYSSLDPLPSFVHWSPVPCPRPLSSHVASYSCSPPLLELSLPAPLCLSTIVAVVQIIVTDDASYRSSLKQRKIKWSGFKDDVFFYEKK